MTTFTLIHEYRKFFFLDPELPKELLPPGWQGRQAREVFRDFHERLAEPANRFFDSVFEAPPPRRRRLETDLATGRAADFAALASL